MTASRRLGKMRGMRTNVSGLNPNAISGPLARLPLANIEFSMFATLFDFIVGWVVTGIAINSGRTARNTAIMAEERASLTEAQKIELQAERQAGRVPEGAEPFPPHRVWRFSSARWGPWARSRLMPRRSAISSTSATTATSPTPTKLPRRPHRNILRAARRRRRKSPCVVCLRSARLRSFRLGSWRFALSRRTRNCRSASGRLNLR